MSYPKKDSINNKYESLSLKVDGEEFWILDQTLIPHQEVWLRMNQLNVFVEAIQTLKIRGAPLIGVTAALFYEQFQNSHFKNPELLNEVFHKIRSARPTAVNLMNAMDRVKNGESAWKILLEDVDNCYRIAQAGFEIIKDGQGILTHCNTGALATAGAGTALGVIKYAHDQGKAIQLYIDETRPLGQGARLTSWEAQKYGIPSTLICDNMAAFLMSRQKIQSILVGADRITRNGDFANKIGTYSLAVLAHHHKIPFYCVAPFTTFDPLTPSGSQIPIEERSADEVRAKLAPPTIPVWNPAFDITPSELVTGYITDKGYFSSMDLENIWNC